MTKFCTLSWIRLYSKMTGRSRLADLIFLPTVNEVSFGAKPEDRFGEPVGNN